MTIQIATIRDSLLSGFTTFINYIPTLLGAFVLIAIGWLVSSLVAKLVDRILTSFKVNEAAERTGFNRLMIGPRGHYHVSYVVAVLAKWFIRLIFLQAAANILNMPQVTLIINNILLFIPNLAIALLIVVIGIQLGRFVAGLVFEATASAGVGRPDLFALITKYAVGGFAVIAALNQLGIAVVVVNTLFIGLVASLSLALGLAFGLGGQGVASEVTRTWYNQSKSFRLKSVPRDEASGLRNQAAEK